MSGILHGAKVLLTRQQSDCAELETSLGDIGATVKCAPMISVKAIPQNQQIRDAKAQLYDYHWILVTSQNAVRYFFADLPKPIDHTPKIAAVGPATAKKLKRQGWQPDFVGDAKGAKSLWVDLCNSYKMTNTRLLYPCSSLAKTDIRDRALKSGAKELHMVHVYKTEPSDRIDSNSIADVDIAVFYSDSAVIHFPSPSHLKTISTIAVGPSTFACLRSNGAVHITQSKTPSIDRVTLAVVDAWKQIQQKD